MSQKAMNLESDEPAVGLDVVSNPQPKVHHREAWFRGADRASRPSAELNWGIFCGLHTLNEHQYPFTTLQELFISGPLEEAYSYLVGVFRMDSPPQNLNNDSAEHLTRLLGTSC